MGASGTGGTVVMLLASKEYGEKKNVLEVCRTIIVYDLMYGVARLLSISLQGICKPFNSWL